MTTVNARSKRSHREGGSLRTRMATTVLALAALGFVAAPTATAHITADPITVHVPGVVTVEADLNHGGGDWPWGKPRT